MALSIVLLKQASESEFTCGVWTGVPGRMWMTRAGNNESALQPLLGLGSPSDHPYNHCSLKREYEISNLGKIKLVFSLKFYYVMDSKVKRYSTKEFTSYSDFKNS